MAGAGRIVWGSIFQLGDDTSAVGVDEVQTVTIGGAPTGGTFRLGYAGGLRSDYYAIPMTTPLAYNASPAAVQAALVLLGTIGTNELGLPNVVVAGTAGGPYTITGANDLAKRAMPMLVGDASALVSGTTATITIAETTAGVDAGAVYASIARLTTLPYPSESLDSIESSDLNIADRTKEFIPGLIDPGSATVEAQYIGGATQDYRRGLISRFKKGTVFPVRVNVPHVYDGPGRFNEGFTMMYSGFLTSASPSGAGAADIMMLAGELKATGRVRYGMPIQ